MEQIIVQAKRTTHEIVRLYVDGKLGTALCAGEFNRRFPKISRKIRTRIELTVSARKPKGEYVTLHRRLHQRWPHDSNFWFGQGNGFFGDTDHWLRKFLPEGVNTFYVTAREV